MITSDDRYTSFMAKDQYFREVKPLLKLTDAERTQLLQRVLCGNTERGKARPNQWRLSLAKHARARLVEEFQPLVICIARRHISRFKEGTELLDLIQEGNIGLLDAFDTYTVDDGDFASFVSRAIARPIARFRYREGLQKAESLQARLFDDQVEGDLDFVPLYAVTVPQNQVCQEELAAVLYQALENGLAPGQRQVIGLLYGLGKVPVSPHSQIEVSRLLAVKPGSIATQSAHAYKRLAEVLHPTVDKNGQATYKLDPIYQETYCSFREAIALFHVSKSQLEKWVVSGQLSFQMGKDTRSGYGDHCRFYLKQELCDLLGLSSVPFASGDDESEVA